MRQIVLKEGIAIDLENIKDIMDLPTLKKIGEVRSFMVSHVTIGDLLEISPDWSPNHNIAEKGK